MSEGFNIGVVIITWLACAAFTWGVTTERLKSITRRVEALEQEKFVTRTEYEARHRELLEEIRRIRQA